ncbi:hypothetical protein SZ54_3836 [Rhizobium sp. UR51a]|nr:hypothetical protein SZ54_3836 [Rhizobium sp. UR51a]
MEKVHAIASRLAKLKRRSRSHGDLTGHIWRPTGEGGLRSIQEHSMLLVEN